VADGSALHDPRLVRHLFATAEAFGLQYQIRQPGGGGTDAGATHKQRAGIPSISISVPGRYLHSPASIARLSDWQNGLSLVQAALLRLSPDVLKEER
jgi:endoglucanase